MLHLLQPIWLAAMAAISFPVAVHLWNDRRGKVLRIGSVALLSGVTQQLGLFVGWAVLDSDGAGRKGVGSGRGEWRILCAGDRLADEGGV
jgi:hypothetical protein